MPNATLPAATAGPALDDAALDRLIASGGLSIPDLTTRGATFRLYTGAATAAPDDLNPDTGNPRVHAIGSSTIRDLQGDTMALSALQDMQKAPPGLAIFVNHSYQMPEDLVGRLFDYPTSQMKRDIADLMLDVEVLSSVNPRAKQLYAGIQAGVRQGVSIGCMITAAEWVDEDGKVVPDDEVDWWDVWCGLLHLNILGVDPLEWSFVGIPANQRSWVQYAAQGLFRRALQNGDGEQARRLAPLVRGWFPKDFHDDLLTLAGNDRALRTFVDEAPARQGSDGRQLLWLPAKSVFALRNPQTKHLQELSRQRVGALLADELTASAAATLTTKAATGKSDWPLAERDHAWDSGAAHKRIVEWAGGSDDPDVSKLKSVHFYSPDDADDKQSVSKYKLLFSDDVSGTIKAIPRAIMACWGGHGVDQTTGISDEDKAAIKKKLSAYAARMRKEFDDDTIMPPWDKEDGDSGKQTEPEMTKAATTAAAPETETPAATTETASAETPEVITDPDALEIKQDGSHAAFKGSHAHNHSSFGSQGGDETHDHNHSHDNDANHDHHGASADGGSDSSDSDESAKSAAADAAMTCCHVGAPHTDACTCGPDCACMSADAEAAKSAPADGIQKQGVEMTADGVEHMVTLADAATQASAQPSAAETEQRAVMFRAFSDMVAPHGFVVMEVTEAQRLTAQSAEPSAEPAKRAGWDDTQEASARAGITAIDTIVDNLMVQLGIPNHDSADEGTAEPGADEPDNSDVAGPRYPVTGAAETSASVRRLLTRAGARNSAADQAQLQTIHDAVYALTDGMCCSAATTETPEGEGDGADGADTASGNGGGQSATSLEDAQALLGGGGASMAAMPQLVASIADVATTLKGLSLPALDEKVTALLAAVEAAKAQQDVITAAQERTAADIARLRGAPQGRPTAQAQAGAFAQRSAASDPDAAIPIATADSLTPAGQAAEAARQRTLALAQTSVQYVAGVGQCRYWPEGVGKDAGQRPLVTQLQRLALETGMSAIRRALPDGAHASSAEALLAAYTSGGAALIPIVLDGE